MSNEEKEKDKKFGDFVKKMVNTGLGAALMTEDLVKGALNDFSLPKEIAGQLMQNAKNTKEEALKTLEKALKEHLAQIDVQKELSEFVANHDIEIKTSLSFKKKKKAGP